MVELLIVTDESAELEARHNSPGLGTEVAVFEDMAGMEVVDLITGTPMKPRIFLSHITEEAEVASLFKEAIEEAYLGMVEVFQSSDQISLPVGKNWLDGITDALRACEAILVFCSPYSVTRPWINFECGAGWAREIEVVPICHSGLRPVDLPVPISLLQGVSGSDPTALPRVFDMITGKLGSKTPDIAYDALAEKIGGFEARNVEEEEISKRLRQIESEWPGLLKILGRAKAGEVGVIGEVPEKYIERCRKPFDSLQKRGHFSYRFESVGMSIGGPDGGNYGNLTVKISEKLLDKIRGFLN